MSITSTQTGLIAENLVINQLVIASGGQLIPFRPVADDYGIDLLVYDKITGRALPLQVKARTKTLKKSGSSERGNIVHFNVREVAIRQKGQTRLLAVLLDEEMTHVRCAWMMHLDQVKHIGTKRKDRFVLRPSCSANSTDKFRPYYFVSIAALAGQLIKEFERFDKTFPPSKVLR